MAWPSSGLSEGNDFVFTGLPCSLDKKTFLSSFTGVNFFHCSLVPGHLDQERFRGVVQVKSRVKSILSRDRMSSHSGGGGLSAVLQLC